MISQPFLMNTHRYRRCMRVCIIFCNLSAFARENVKQITLGNFHVKLLLVISFPENDCRCAHVSVSRADVQLSTFRKLINLNFGQEFFFRVPRPVVSVIKASHCGSQNKCAANGENLRYLINDLLEAKKNCVL